MLNLVAVTAAAIVLLQAAPPAQAQTFPNRPVRVVVSAPPGTAPDLVARAVAQKASEGLGVAMVVENRPGGGGIPAINALASAAPDGHALLFTDTGVYSILPNLNESADLLKSLTPLSLGGTTPLYLGVSAASGVSSVPELVAMAKGKPGLPYGSSGNATAAHLFMELVKSVAGVDMTHVPHKGAAPAVQSMMAGDVVAVFSGVNLLVPQAKANKIRVIGVAAERRSRLLPDVPAMGEVLPGYNIKALTLGWLVPNGTPEAVQERLRAEIARATQSAEVVQRLHALDIEPPQSFAADAMRDAIRGERQQYGAIIRSAGIKAQ